MPEDINVDEWEFYEAIEKMSQGEAIKEIREKVELPLLLKDGLMLYLSFLYITSMRLQWPFTLLLDS